MTPTAALVAELQARGVTLEPDGDKLRVRPTPLVTPEELDELRRCKAQVLALLHYASRLPRVTLHPMAVREALGPSPHPHALAGLTFDVLAAVRRIEAEIATGRIGPAPLQVRGRPLSDWLTLDALAWLLRSPTPRDD